MMARLGRNSGVREPVTIAVTFGRLSYSQFAEIRQGVLAYGLGRKWKVLSDPDAAGSSLAKVAGWPVDGIVTALSSTADIRAAKTAGIPVVNVTGMLPTSPTPRVSFDNVAIGRLAAEHLQSCGYKHLACFSVRNAWYARVRVAAFGEGIVVAGREPPRVVEMPGCYSGQRTAFDATREVDSWLSELPRETGVFAVNDRVAALLVDACERVGRRLPDDIGVMGVNDERAICETLSPQLSSIARNDRRVGEVAAATLEQLIDGKQTAAETLIEPTGVVCRGTTRGGAMDGLVGRVARFLTEHAPDELAMHRLALHFGCSRRSIERAFRQVMDTSPAAYLAQARVHLAIALCRRDQRLSLKEVARQSGFYDAKHLRRTCRAHGIELPSRAQAGRSCR